MIRPNEKSRKKRLVNREAQERYWEAHKFCEVCIVEKQRRAWGVVNIHEILYRSQGGKCTDDNMIALCMICHDRAHRIRKPFLSRERLYEIKELYEKASNLKVKATQR